MGSAIAVIHENLIRLDIPFAEIAGNGAGVFQHGEDVGEHEGGGEEVFHDREHAGALPFPAQVILGIIIPAVASPEADVAAIKTGCGSGSGVRYATHPGRHGRRGGLMGERDGFFEDGGNEVHEGAIPHVEFYDSTRNLGLNSWGECFRDQRDGFRAEGIICDFAGEINTDALIKEFHFFDGGFRGEEFIIFVMGILFDIFREGELEGLGCNGGVRDGRAQQDPEEQD